MLIIIGFVIGAVLGCILLAIADFWLSQND